MSEIKNKLVEVKSTIELESKIKFSQKFLEITGLKVGDEVTAYFSYNNGTSKQSYHTGGEKKGVLKKHENGTLFVESIEDLTFSHSCSNNRSGRSYRSWWEYEKRKGKADIMSIKFKEEERRKE